MRDLLDPKYGMFDIFNETGCIWFKYGVNFVIESFLEVEVLYLVGVLSNLNLSACSISIKYFNHIEQKKES